MAIEELRLTAQDGYPLAATRFHPPDGAARGNVLILAATGVPQDYYRKFALYLAERGFTALTSPFSARFRDTLWREAVDWLEAHACRS